MAISRPQRERLGHAAPGGRRRSGSADRPAHVHVDDGSEATTAWWLALDWIKAVNARTSVSYDKTATEISGIANAMWVADAWLPDGELDWDLLAASPTDAPGWGFAWRMPARTPAGQAVFTIVRDSKDDPWRILTLDR